MNEALKAMHMQTITEENAVKIYDALCEACEMRDDRPRSDAGS